MIDGLPLIDVHLHPAHQRGLKLPWDIWLQDFSVPSLRDLYDPDGAVRPAAFDALLAAEGVDIGVILAEYSPKVTGWQTVEEMLPLCAANPERVKFAANVNPHLHFPVADEVQRQLALGAVALKVHPVHGGFPVNDRAMYPAYEICQSLQVPVVVHCGTSTFPGAMNQFGDPVLLDDVLRDFRSLRLVLAHGGRGWWYDQAAFLALMRPNVWVEVSGLPPQRLPDYYGPSLRRLADKMVFGTDWPGVPGVLRNARVLEKVLLDAGCTAAQVASVLGGHAGRVFGLS